MVKDIFPPPAGPAPGASLSSPSSGGRRRDDGKAGLAGLRVLYVEDDAAARGQLEQFLRRRVRELHVADSGVAGLESFKRNQPDIVVTDIRMADMDGLRMAREIKALNTRVPIVVTSSFRDSSYLLEAIDLGIERYVLKPVDVDRLLSALEFCVAIVSAERRTRLSQSVIDAASDAVVVLDSDGTICSVNPAFRAIAGYQDGEILGRQVGVLFDGDEASAILPTNTGRRWRGEQRMRRADGAVFVALCTLDPVSGSSGEIQHWVLMFRDFTEAKRVRDEMQYRASHDVLTGLLNRASFDEHLRRAIEHARAGGQMLGVLFVDLDRFKDVNDQHGHVAGDLVLRETGARLRSAVRTGDLVSRRGGDEFVVMLRHVCDAAEVGAVAQRIQAAMEPEFCVEDRRLPIRCSIGAAVYPRDATTARELLRFADKGMYDAKKAGWERNP
jgi:diguanylate cyclase (GGDEF)-like protein/PAS domain S-box-containing protein